MLQAQSNPKDYVVAVSDAVNNDAEWITIVDELIKIHPDAVVITYKDSLKELLPSLKELHLAISA